MSAYKEIKCVVWDLDNTIWDGILLESENVKLKEGIINVLNELDNRGILHSIASRNNYDDAMRKLKEFGIDNWFLYPEINWNSKSKSIDNIKKNLNIGIDSIMFIDDQEFELEEVGYGCKGVETFNAADYLLLLDHKRLNPRFITSDSKRRRLMYLEDFKRSKLEQEYEGPQESFLKSLNMSFIISDAKEEDLKRAEELTIRTNQLNTTGNTYSFNELNEFRKCANYKLYICELTDKFGSYGKIGLALIELNKSTWNIKLFLMSCRVMSRGVGSVLLSFIMHQAQKENKRLLADFKQTDRNRMMYITYKFGNFKEISNDKKGNIVLENDLLQIQPIPGYVKLIYNEDSVTCD